MTRLAAAALTLVALGAPARAAGASAPLITPNGIGALRLGQGERTAGAVLRRAGLRPYPSRRVTIRPGVEYVEREYRRTPADVHYVVGFQGARGARRVVFVGTFLERLRTPEGARVGISERRLRGIYGDRLQCRPFAASGTAFIGRTCRLGDARRRHLVFLFPPRGCAAVYEGCVSRRIRSRVLRIVVRGAGIRIPPI